MIRVVTDLKKYELDIRAIVNVFYPWRLVVFSDKKMKSTPWMIIDVISDDNGVEISFSYEGEKLVIKEKVNTAIYGGTAKEELLSSRELKNKLKLGLYKGLSQITGHSSEWGTLTGVRPTKLAFMLKKEKLGRSEIIERLGKDYLCVEDKAKLILDIADYECDKVSDYIDEDSYSLYIGIPFCPTTCLYCSFASNPIGGNNEKITQYLETLYKEIEETALFMKGKRLISIYVGGGTPTSLNEQQIDELLNKIKREFNFEKVFEYE